MISRTPLSVSSSVFFFNATATTEIYTLSLHDALPICQFDPCRHRAICRRSRSRRRPHTPGAALERTLADVDFHSPIPRLGNPVGRGKQRLASAAASSEDALSGDAHFRQDRLHALGSLKRERIVGWIWADQIGVANDGNVRRLSTRDLGEQTLYFLLRLLGKFVVAALEIEGEGNRARRLGRERTAKNVFNFALACGATLHTAIGGCPGCGVRGIEHSLALLALDNDCSDFALLVRQQHNQVLARCGAAP